MKGKVSVEEIFRDKVDDLLRRDLNGPNRRTSLAESFLHLCDLCSQIVSLLSEIIHFSRLDSTTVLDCKESSIRKTPRKKPAFN